MPAIVRAKSPRKKRGRDTGWWGSGPSPVEQWPGVTIPIDAAWSRLKHRWETTDGLYYFDADEADRACEFFPKYLTHYLGEFAGKQFDLLAYQSLLLTRPLFGWKRISDGLRRFRKLFAFIPKGGGKSPWGAGTGLYLMLCDGEMAAEVYAVAADRKQARTVHDNAKNMVEDSSELSDLCEILKDSIVCPATRSTYQVLSADASTKHGFRPHCVIFDEFHAQKNRDLYEALKKSMVKRRQPVMILITHAGYDDESICFEEYDYAKRVLSGNVQDDSCLPVIFEANPADEWSDPTLWPRINPGHGVTVKAEGIAQECREALAEPRKRNDFLRFHLNRWVNQAVSWIPLDWWDACRADESDALTSWPCAAGLDLAQKWDLACFAVVAREMLTDGPTVEIVGGLDETSISTQIINLNYQVMITPFFWIPEETMRQHEREDGVPYSLWVQQGFITKTDGATIDYTRIYRDITTTILPKFPLLKQGIVGYDPAFATDLATQLRDRAHLKMVEMPQNYAHFSEPCHIFEALVKACRAHHSGHRVLRSHIENLAIKRDDAGRIRPVKPKKASKHIDGGVATLMGIKSLMLMPTTPPRFQMMVFGGLK